MSQNNGADLADYFRRIEANGYLQSPEIAAQWSTSVLRTLGINLDGRTKKRLAKTLPEELAFDLKRKYILLHFRDKNMSREAFLKDVARMSGNTDAQFAIHPTKAVFHEVKGYAGQEVSEDVADVLPPEISEMWQQA